MLGRRASLRKVLPLLPDAIHQQRSAPPAVNSKNNGFDNGHFYSSDGRDGGAIYGGDLAQYALLAEYCVLQRRRVPGVHVIPAANNDLLWFGVVFVHEGFYEGAVFRFQITFPACYPYHGCPSVVMFDDIFHPLIDPASRRLETDHAFSHHHHHHLNKHRHHLLHQRHDEHDDDVVVGGACRLLRFIRHVFCHVDATWSVNMHAATLYGSDRESFARAARESVERCHARLYDSSALPADPHAICFSRYQPHIHATVLQSLLDGDKRDKQPAHRHSSRRLARHASTASCCSDFAGLRISGHSWVRPDSLKPFSRSDNVNSSGLYGDG